MAERVLLVTMTTVEQKVLESLVRSAVGADAELYVVAPTTHLSPLQWLADDVDHAREDARALAESVSEDLPHDSEAHPGDSDPVQAIRDALRTFPADKIVIVTAPEDEQRWLESEAGGATVSKFAIPVVHLVAS